MTATTLAARTGVLEVGPGLGRVLGAVFGPARVSVPSDTLVP